MILQVRKKIKKTKPSLTQKQYKAKRTLENLEKTQKPDIRKASIWNGLTIHMPTQQVWAKVFHEVFCSSDRQWFSKSMSEHVIEGNCKNQNPIIIQFEIGTCPHSRANPIFYPFDLLLSTKKWWKDIYCAVI